MTDKALIKEYWIFLLTRFDFFFLFSYFRFHGFVAVLSLYREKIITIPCGLITHPSWHRREPFLMIDTKRRQMITDVYWYSLTTWVYLRKSTPRCRTCMHRCAVGPIIMKTVSSHFLYVHNPLPRFSASFFSLHKIGSA